MRSGNSPPTAQCCSCSISSAPSSAPHPGRRSSCPCSGRDDDARGPGGSARRRGVPCPQRRAGPRPGRHVVAVQDELADLRAEVVPPGCRVTSTSRPARSRNSASRRTCVDLPAPSPPSKADEETRSRAHPTRVRVGRRVRALAHGGSLCDARDSARRGGGCLGGRAQRHTYSGVLRPGRLRFPAHDVSPRRPARPEAALRLRRPPWRSRPLLRARRPNRTVSPSPVRSVPRPSHRSRRWRATTSGSSGPRVTGSSVPTCECRSTTTTRPAATSPSRCSRREQPIPARGSARSSSTRAAPAGVPARSTPRRPTSSWGPPCAHPSTSSASTPRGRAVGTDRLPQRRRPRRLPRHGPDPGRPRRSRTSSRPPAPWRPGARRTTVSCSRHVSTETRPRTWTSCARPSVTASSTTWASPTAPSSARPTRTCSPSGSAGSSSTGSSHPT